jgi:hypothetical protein
MAKSFQMANELRFRLERGASKRGAGAGTAVHDHATGRVQLRLVLGARGVRDELEQSPGDLHGARDVVLPLHRFPNVDKHSLARRRLGGGILWRHGLDLRICLRDHLGHCLRHGILLVLTAALSSVRKSNTILVILLQGLR